MPDTDSNDLLALTAQIVAAHVGKSQVPAETLPELIRTVHAALAGTASPAASEPRRLEPAVPPKRSVFPDYIVCLEDGKKLKMLKRYLSSRFGMTPAQYRERWGLAPDYPMVAPNYAKHRSSLAKKIGLGTKPRSARAK